MKSCTLLFILISFWSFSQKSIKTEVKDSTLIKAQQIIGTDYFETLYYITPNQTFHKRSGQEKLSYSNLQLGKITSANAFNPLKINLFYKDFNTIVILDNRLAEITKVDFNTLKTLRTITHITTSNDNSIWIYNQDTQQLERFDYLDKKTKVTTLPIIGNVLAIESNYNYCWVLTNEYLYVYNYFGSLISKSKNNGYTQIKESNGTLYLQNNNTLYHLADGSKDAIPLNLNGLLIKQFFVTHESLYIYNQEYLFTYKLTITQ